MNAALPNHSLPLGNTRSIGDILIAAGRLKPEDLQRILDAQQIEKLSFGEAAIALNALSKADIDFALSKQFDYAYMVEGQDPFNPQLVAACKPFSRVSENLRAVRSQLMLRWFNSDALRKVMTVVSAGKGDGRSFIAANLAIVFAQQGQRTLLIDGDLRADAQHSQQALFNLEKGVGLSGILAGRATLDVAQPVAALPGLTVLTAGAQPPNPQELLGRTAFAQVLRDASLQFDVILIDTPSGGDYSDGEIIAARAGAALMVARRNETLVPEAKELGARLQDSGVALVGSVLNDA
ncbi:chain length determinant protein tyrosine kinase EpsG [Rhodoferax lacus]|uniref:Chain length determinant protein tyrosine kinase EpsG n=1 Tax=Rhodoferax lacus TaxID=2184758 RepID=A0A3E1R8V6_9BURK|nr:chain length determinant protein tyrosine kinase EpsG [Rhodoferax lacus]RFO95798.1 chain length determinant protein tyrosine kinase EpsG [Rhodoferax lacus]